MRGACTDGGMMKPRSKFVDGAEDERREIRNDLEKFVPVTVPDG